MASDKEVRDFSDVNRIVTGIHEADAIAVRIFLTVVLVAISGVIMISGIKVIGQSEHIEGSPVIGGYGGFYTYWHTAQLEWGIFFTLVGALAIAFSVLRLVSIWKISLN